jgi:hypothetical protein
VRRQGLVAGAVLTAALALGALPGVAGSSVPSPVHPVEAVAFQAIQLPASDDRPKLSAGQFDPALESAGHLETSDALIEPGQYKAPDARPTVSLPALRAVRVDPPKPKPVAPPAAKAAAKPVTVKPVTVKPVTVKPAAPTSYKSVQTGLATWYSAGMTAMRLPYGTHVRICGAAGCVDRVVTDWGPAKWLPSRIVDLTPGDFVRVSGRALGAGIAKVTVYIY